MIDIHCHLLWGMDDGSQSFEDTLSLCHTAVENGIESIILTPHMLDLDTADEFLICREENARELRNVIEQQHLPLQIHTGAEVFLNHKIYTADCLDELTLAGSQYLLCEFPIPTFSRRQGIAYVQELLQQGYKVILAHPERYAVTYADPKFIPFLHSMGIFLQVNAASLAGKYGVEVQKMAESLILKGLVDFIATDAHRPNWRSNRFNAYKADFPPQISAHFLTWATEIAPRLVLQNMDIQAEKKNFF